MPIRERLALPRVMPASKVGHPTGDVDAAGSPVLLHSRRRLLPGAPAPP